MTLKLNMADIWVSNSKTPIFCYAKGTILLFLIVSLAVAHAQPVSFDYSGFGHADKQQPELDGDAAIVDFDYSIRLTRNLGVNSVLVESQVPNVSNFGTRAQIKCMTLLPNFHLLYIQLRVFMEMVWHSS